MSFEPFDELQDYAGGAWEGGGLVHLGCQNLMGARLFVGDPYNWWFSFWFSTKKRYP